MKKRVFQSAVFLWALIIILIAPKPIHADEYRLGPEDLLNVRAVIWNDAERNFVSWDLMRGEYTVQADGTVAIPISGSIRAQGLTRKEFAEAVAQALKEGGGMIEPPRITVEVIRYRPFFVLGDVGRPGAYPSQPGLTAIQALALASGVRGGLQSENPRISGTLRNVGALRDVRNQITRALVRRDRLQAEIANAESVTFDAAVQHPDGPVALATIRKEETAIFVSRKAAHERELAALNGLADLLNSEIDGLARKSAGIEEQLQLARENLTNMQSLAERGLTQATRLADAQRRVFDLEANETDLQNNIYRARQRISENRRDIVELQAQRETRGVVELQDINAKLEQLINNRAMLEQVILADGLLAEASDLGDLEITYSLIRAGTDSNTPEPIAPTDFVAPGDVLTVTATFADDAIGTQ